MRLAEVKFPRIEIATSLYSEGLRLRPNYLIYVFADEVVELQKQYLQGAQIPWAEYLDCSEAEAIISFCKSVQGGIYMPVLNDELNQKKPKICLFLLDPHLIDDFEDKISKKRRGVVIRRPVLASLNFQETISLS